MVATSRSPTGLLSKYRENPVVNVIQDGARLHYALPVALQRQGILGTVFTDWFVRPGSREDNIARWVRRISPNLGRRLTDRCCLELDNSRVVSSYWLAVHKGLLSRAIPATPESRDLRLSKAFARWVDQRDWRGGNAIIGFVRNIAPQLCAAAKARRLVTVVDQMIAPAEIQLAEASRQTQRWPEWRGLAKSANWELVIDLERQTWALADHIICPSAYVREGLLQQGIAPDRISVIPYPIDSAGFRFFDRRDRSGPLVVGFVGAVGLRKGAPAFFEVARSFAPGEARFVMVGPVEPEIRLASYKGPVELTGAIPRSQVLGWLEKFDVLLFPSTCEGSAGAVMEALATGLPVITTPNSGSVVRHGIEGFICACNDISAFVQSLNRLREDPALRIRMGRTAREHSQAFNLDGYGRSLDRVFRCLFLQRAKADGSAAPAEAHNRVQSALWPDFDVTKFQKRAIR
jgi:glycosyltransferase involved in cell wall biosynthesis